MVDLILRSEKGSPLTHNEVDANFVALRDSGGSGGILNVRDFGCVGDGITDDTENFQAAIDALFQQERGSVQYAVGGRLRVPYGTYKLSRLNIFRKNGPGDFTSVCFEIAGDGPQNTVLFFSDPDIGVEIGNASGFTISGLSFVGTGAASTPGTGSDQSLIVIGLLNSASGTGVYMSRFHNCAVGGAKIGISVQAPIYPPANTAGEVLGCASELHFDTCQISSCDICFYVAQYNALDFLFSNCGMGFCNYAVYQFFGGGEITFLGGSLSFADVAFHCGGTDNVTVIGTRIEAGGVVMETDGGGCFTIIGLASANSDEVGNIVHNGGYLLLDSCQLGGPVRVGGQASGLVMRHCNIDATEFGIQATEPFTQTIDGIATIEGHMYYRVEGCRVSGALYPDEVGVMRGGNNRIPFSWNSFLASTGSADATVAGQQFHGLNGQTLLTNVATSDPGFAGQIWSDAGTLKISTGNSWSQQYKAPGIKLSNTLTLPLMRAEYMGAADADHWASVLGSVGKSTGKWYFEVKLIEAGATAGGGGGIGASVGVGLNTMTLDGTGGTHAWAGTLNSIGLRSDQTGATTGDVYVNTNGFVGPTFGNVTGMGYVEGDIVQIAVDADGDLVWFGLNDSGTWNGGAGTPAAGTGGYDVSTITGTFYPVCSIYKSNGTHTLANVMQASCCWEAYFTTTNYAPPTGFTRWA